ncbi:ATP-binding cassette domain-containing protein [Aquirufa aurantiipilula]
MDIQINNLSLGYKKKNPIIMNADFALKSGEICFIIGKNGCGKSTLLKGILDGIPYSNGEIFINYQLVVPANKKDILTYTGICLSPGFSYPHLTVEENIKNIQFLYPKESLLPMNELLDIFNLRSYKKIKTSQLSSGLQKKLDFALSIMHQPSLILLDEPTSNLDSQSQKEILEFIHYQNRIHKVSFLISSHQFDDIEKLNAHYIVLNNGRIEFDSRNTSLEKKTPISDIFNQIVSEKHHVL